MFKTVVMRTKWFIWVPLLFLVVFLAAIWAADSWLESPAGRAHLESALTEAVKVPVSLGGDFNISFWPAVGISGSDLHIGGTPNSDTEGERTGVALLRCDSFHVSVALWPLLRGQLIVLAVRAKDGAIDPGQLSDSPQGSSGESSRPVELPRVDFFQLENFRMPLDSEGKLALELHHMEISGFQAGAVTPLDLAFSITRSAESLARVEIESAFKLDSEVTELVWELNRLDLQSGGWELDQGHGALNWSRAQNEIALGLAGQERSHGKVNFSGAFSPGTLSGNLAMEVLRPDLGESLMAGLSFQPMPGGIELTGIQLESADQRINGRGCFRSGNESSLHLVLESERIDFERLQAWLPAGDGTAAGLDMTNVNLTFQLNLELSVGEVRSGGVVASGVSIEAGGQPDCSEVPDRLQ